MVIRLALAALSMMGAAGALTGRPLDAQAAPLPQVPSYLAPVVRDSLLRVRAQLDSQLVAYRNRKADYDAACPVGATVTLDVKKACDARRESEMPGAIALGNAKAAFVANMKRLESLAPAINSDPTVVDARDTPEGTDLIEQVPELAKSPARGQIIKGYQGVIHHDWPMALLWWKAALLADPNNAALKRSVELAHWMVDRKNGVALDLKDAPAERIPPLSAAIYAAARGDNVSAIRHFEEAKKENPSSAAGLDDMIDILQHKEDNRNVWSKAEIQAYDARINKEADEYLRKGLKAQAAGDYKGAQTLFFIEQWTRGQVSTDSPPPGAPRLMRKK